MTYNEDRRRRASVREYQEMTARFAWMGPSLPPEELRRALEVPEEQLQRYRPYFSD